MADTGKLKLQDTTGISTSSNVTVRGFTKLNDNFSTKQNSLDNRNNGRPKSNSKLDKNIANGKNTYTPEEFEEKIMKKFQNRNLMKAENSVRSRLRKLDEE